MKHKRVILSDKNFYILMSRMELKLQKNYIKDLKNYKIENLDIFEICCE